MKSILKTLRPEPIANVLNGLSTILVCKKFPKDYVGWVYIYCTKGKPYLWQGCHKPMHDLNTHNPFNYCWHCHPKDSCFGGFSGKVVARFWCDKVEEILMKNISGNIYTNTLSNNKLLTKSCLADNEIKNYLSGNWHKKYNYWFGGYAIHISKLEIFDRPKELNEFDRPCQHWDNEHQCYSSNLVCCAKSCKFYKNTRLTKAPLNYCYIEGEE